MKKHAVAALFATAKRLDPPAPGRHNWVGSSDEYDLGNMIYNKVLTCEAFGLL
jgi:hypothetical protein